MKYRNFEPTGVEKGGCADGVAPMQFEAKAPRLTPPQADLHFQRATPSQLLKPSRLSWNDPVQSEACFDRMSEPDQFGPGRPRGSFRHFMLRMTG